MADDAKYEYNEPDKDEVVDQVQTFFGVFPVTKKQKMEAEHELEIRKRRAEAAGMLRSDFKLERKCPKCGYEGFGPGGKWPKVTYCRNENEHCGMGEHLDRQCRRCGYYWPENVLSTNDAGI